MSKYGGKEAKKVSHLRTQPTSSLTKSGYCSLVIMCSMDSMILVALALVRGRVWTVVRRLYYLKSYCGLTISFGQLRGVRKTCSVDNPLCSR
jgi:hypothetical protein